MNTKNLIPIKKLCSHYQVGLSFFSHLNEIGLIEIHKIDRIRYIHLEKIEKVEKIIRLHQELEINPEGIDIVFNLLEKINTLEDEIYTIKNRLRIYEN